ncbi:B-cell receptor CD22-like [Paramuricea clavata]|uniref:B-cell receptor CD22-like n=1 Tax=Paramuricea clavata TaxID=317549 RepID=A0A6S7JH43_PARCT|nr:B-cell receptor CD22-like [Paramuricea clavata]
MCESNGLPEPSYTITHNGTMLSTGKMYTIPKVKWSDAGTYKCIAENKLGRDSAFAYLTFHGWTRLEKYLQTAKAMLTGTPGIDSRFKPENTKITITQEGVLGSPVTITCNSEGHPEPNYTITHNGITLSAGKMYTIPKVKWSDAGTYRCIAGNKLGSDSAFAYLTFHDADPPTVISLTSTPEIVVFGESVVITCEAIAVPLPSYTIIHNDTEIVSTHKTYIITVLEYSHAGSYKCIATSILGNSSKAFSLSVGGKAALEKCNGSGTEWYMVVGILEYWCLGLSLEFFFPTLSFVLVVNLEVNLRTSAKP